MGASTASAPAASAASQLEQELRELRGEDSEGNVVPKARIALFSEVGRGIAVIACPRGLELDPSFPKPTALVNQAFTSRMAGGEESDRAVRFAVKMIPLDFIC